MLTLSAHELLEVTIIAGSRSRRRQRLRGRFLGFARFAGYHAAHMRRPGGILVVMAMVLVSAPAFGVHCAIDQVPAATLLVPYFEVDYAAALAPTTLVFVTNTSSAAAVAHVTLWTDWGIPALDFDIYLTGHDVQTFNLRDIITHGVLPRTADRGADAGSFGTADSLSPSPPPGPTQAPNVDPFTGTFTPLVPTEFNFGGSSGPCVAPYVNPALSEAARADLQAKLTGAPIPSTPTLCAGSPRGNTLARGYVTIDTVTGCTLLNPASPGYFSGVASNANQLIGEMLVIDSSTAVAASYPVVHLEAATLPTGARSFYGRFVGDTGADGREPLPSSFAARFIPKVNPSSTSGLFVWRETGDDVDPVICGSAPAWAPLTTKPVQLFDEQTQSAKPAAALPVATQRLDLFTDIANPFQQGLALLDLDYTLGSRPAQAFVTSMHVPLGSSPEESLDVRQLEDACTGRHFFPLLRDGFENGLVPWSESSP
jgi:hypothetical protein